MSTALWPASTRLCRTRIGRSTSAMCMPTVGSLFKERIESLELPEAARKRIDEELQKMSVLELGSPKYTVTRGRADKVRVRAGDVEEYLGKPVFEKERRMSGVVVTGLAWTPLGGATLAVEANRIHGQARGFKLTGQLGDVMKESAEIAYSYVAGNTRKLDADPAFFDDSFVHLHVPAGATPKDGPSAGITMATALLSLARRRRAKNRIAMTGELTLTGQVLPVGGIQEKILAARRAGIKELCGRIQHRLWPLTGRIRLESMETGTRDQQQSDR